MSTRRDLLRLAGLAGFAGAAGCTAIAGDQPFAPPGDDGGDESRPSDNDSPPGATHRVSVVASDGDPDIPVRPGVALADPYATSGSPPVLRVDVDNPTDDPVVVGEYRPVVFQYVSDDDGTLVLLPHSDRSTDGEPDRSLPDHETTGEGCWKLVDHPAVTMEYGTVEIPEDGTLTAFVGLYATPDAGGCLPPGEHRFEATYAHFADGRFGDPSGTERWGFSLAAERL